MLRVALQRIVCCEGDDRLWSFWTSGKKMASLEFGCPFLSFRRSEAVFYSSGCYGLWRSSRCPCHVELDAAGCNRPGTGREGVGVRTAASRSPLARTHLVCARSRPLTISAFEPHRSRVLCPVQVVASLFNGRRHCHLQLQATPMLGAVLQSVELHTVWPRSSTGPINE